MNRPEGSLRPLRQEKVRNLIEIYRKYKNEEKKMPLKTIAIYREGCLKPLEPLDLQEGETILIEILKTSSSIAEKIPGSIVYIEEDPIKILSSERR